MSRLMCYRKGKFWNTNRVVGYAVLLSVFLCIFIGCKRIIGNPGRHTVTNIQPSALYGTWKIKDESLRNLIQEGYYKYSKKENHRIVISENGDCEVWAYFYTFDGPTLEEQEKYYISGLKGRWKLTTEYDYVYHMLVQLPAVEIEIKRISRFEESTITLTFYIAEENGNIVLWNYIGDPDYTQYMDFALERSQKDKR